MNFKYKTRLDKWNPIKGYISQMTLAILEAINQELYQLEKAKFIEPSNSPFTSPTICVLKNTKVSEFALISG